jgi:hypothetical protein
MEEPRAFPGRSDFGTWEFHEVLVLYNGFAAAAQTQFAELDRHTGAKIDKVRQSRPFQQNEGSLC